MSQVKLYKNGSMSVLINTETGTKVISGDTFEPDFPDTLDIKITDYCSNRCSFCYESSGLSGKHCNTTELLRILDTLPDVPLEVALGGGNPIDHPEFEEITYKLHQKGFIVNTTINICDVYKIVFNSSMYRLKHISGLGVSIGSFDITNESLLFQPSSLGVKQVVYHCILGITPINSIKYLLEHGYRVLILGYKNMGRAKVESIPDLRDYESFLKLYIHSNTKTGVLTFDNLGAEQINLFGALLREDWDKYWMGTDFTHSMYIDAVDKKFYPSSTQRSNGVSWESIPKYFKENHVKNLN